MDDPAPGRFNWWKILVPIVVLSFVLSKDTQIQPIQHQTNAVFNILESDNFKKLVTCPEVSSGVACFNSYGFALAREAEKAVGRSFNIKSVNDCTQQIIRRKETLTFVLEVLSCFITDSHEKKAVSFGVGSTFKSIILLGGVICLGRWIVGRSFETFRNTNVAMNLKVEDVTDENSIGENQLYARFNKPVTDYDDSSTTQSSTLSLNVTKPIGFKENTKEYGKPQTLRVFVTVDNKTFNLETQSGKEEWRNHVYLKSKRLFNCQGVNDKESKKSIETKPTSLPAPTEIKLDTSSFTPEAEPNKMKKARDDINIHDPDQPVPSVLDYKVVDKSGRPLRRIFIPGRGWISAKTLKLERVALGLTAQPQPLNF